MLVSIVAAIAGLAGCGDPAPAAATPVTTQNPQLQQVLVSGDFERLLLECYRVEDGRFVLHGFVARDRRGVDGPWVADLHCYFTHGELIAFQRRGEGDELEPMVAAKNSEKVFLTSQFEDALGRKGYDVRLLPFDREVEPVSIGTLKLPETTGGAPRP